MFSTLVRSHALWTCTIWMDRWMDGTSLMSFAKEKHPCSMTLPLLQYALPWGWSVWTDVQGKFTNTNKGSAGQPKNSILAPSDQSVCLFCPLLLLAVNWGYYDFHSAVAFLSVILCNA